jgi:hypothetical protein
MNKIDHMNEIHHVNEIGYLAANDYSAVMNRPERPSTAPQ